MMSAEFVSMVLAYGLLVWFALLVGIILLQMLNGDIPLEGLFQSQDDIQVLPERVALFALSVAGPVAYLLAGLSVECVPAPGGCSLPEIPEGALTALGGANAIYIAGKAARH